MNRAASRGVSVRCRLVRHDGEILYLARGIGVTLVKGSIGDHFAPIFQRVEQARFDREGRRAKRRRRVWR